MKLKFWKKDDLNIDRELKGMDEFSKDMSFGSKDNFGKDNLAKDTLGLDPNPGMIDIPNKYPEAKFDDMPSLTPTQLSPRQYQQAQPLQQNHSAELMAKDIEIISSKLDAVRTSI